MKGIALERIRKLKAQSTVFPLLQLKTNCMTYRRLENCLVVYLYDILKQDGRAAGAYYTASLKNNKNPIIFYYFVDKNTKILGPQI